MYRGVERVPSGTAAFWRSGQNGLYVQVKALPKARQTMLQGIHPAGGTGQALKIAVKAAPEDGKANAAIEAFLAESLGVAKSRVTVVSGGTSRNKIVKISGDATAILRQMEDWIDAAGIERTVTRTES